MIVTPSTSEVIFAHALVAIATAGTMPGCHSIAGHDGEFGDRERADSALDCW
ncbi:MAG: hypothetical protein ABI862_12760 [Ilumatobacteraceae bacterium]